MIIKYLIQKEFIQIRRNSFLPRFIIMYPILMMCVMLWVMNMEVRHIRVDVIDNDRSTLSRQLIQSVAASQYFVFNAQRSTYKETIADVERSDADIIMNIPRHYERDVKKGISPKILLSANAANPIKGGMGTNYLTQVVAMNKTQTATLQTSPVQALYLFNKHLNYKVFMIPALMGILLLLICGFLPALNIVSEKEVGTIEQINATPVSKWTFIFSKLIPYWLIAIVVMTLCFVLAWILYGISCKGSLWLIYLNALLLSLCFSGLGLIISNYSDTLQQAVFVMWFLVMCMILLSGLFTPVRSMPHWAQMSTIINPMHYFIDAIRTVFVRGGNAGSIWRELTVLSTMAMILDVWAVQSYRKNK